MYFLTNLFHWRCKLVFHTFVLVPLVFRKVRKILNRIVTMPPSGWCKVLCQAFGAALVALRAVRCDHCPSHTSLPPPRELTVHIASLCACCSRLQPSLPGLLRGGCCFWSPSTCFSLSLSPGIRTYPPPTDRHVIPVCESGRPFSGTSFWESWVVQAGLESLPESSFMRASWEVCLLSLGSLC